MVRKAKKPEPTKKTETINYMIELREKSFLGFTYNKTIALVPTKQKMSGLPIIAPKNWKIIKE